MEDNKLLPESQHGFRAKRSMMTALSEIQRDWIENTEEKRSQEYYFVDLSAAFDTLNSELQIQKLRIYSCNEKT